MIDQLEGATLTTTFHLFRGLVAPRSAEDEHDRREQVFPPQASHQVLSDFVSAEVASEKEQKGRKNIGAKVRHIIPGGSLRRKYRSKRSKDYELSKQK